MRNSYKYYGFNKVDLLNILLNISKDFDYISLLVSNLQKNETDLPQDYINYDILAGVGKKDVIISNNESFKELYDFYSLKRDFF